MFSGSPILRGKQSVALLGYDTTGRVNRFICWKIVTCCKIHLNSNLFKNKSLLSIIDRQIKAEWFFSSKTVSRFKTNAQKYLNSLIVISGWKKLAFSLHSCAKSLFGPLLLLLPPGMRPVWGNSESYQFRKYKTGDITWTRVRANEYDLPT